MSWVGKKQFLIDLLDRRLPHCRPELTTLLHLVRFWTPFSWGPCRFLLTFPILHSGQPSLSLFHSHRPCFTSSFSSSSTSTWIRPGLVYLCISGVLLESENGIRLTFGTLWNFVRDCTWTYSRWWGPDRSFNGRVTLVHRRTGHQSRFWIVCLSLNSVDLLQSGIYGHSPSSPSDWGVRCVNNTISDQDLSGRGGFPWPPGSLSVGIKG